MTNASLVPSWQIQVNYFSKFREVDVESLFYYCTGTFHMKNLMGSKAIDHIGYVKLVPDFQGFFLSI